MRVLQINSVSGYGSTGRSTEELAKFLNDNGHECFIAYGHLKTEYPNSFKYGSCVEKKWYAVYFRLFGQQGLSGYYGTQQLIKYISKIRPDVVHLNNLHGNHLNLPLLFNYLSTNKYR